MADKYILATSGGFVAGDRYGVMKPGPTVLRGLELTNKTRPRVLFIHTASGDDKNYLVASYQAMSSYSCDVEHLSLFTQPTDEVEAIVGRADFVWVGGGSVANLLALWKLHGVDDALREAYDRGAVLGGVSAGSICWHLGGPTDSFGPQLAVVHNGMGLIPFANGVHYDSEEQRRPLLQSLIRDKVFTEAYATDDRVGLLYRNGEAAEVIVDKEVDPIEGPSAYHVVHHQGEAVETRLSHGLQ